MTLSLTDALPAAPLPVHRELQFCRSRRLSHSFANTVHLSHRVQYAGLVGFDSSSDRNNDQDHRSGRFS